MHATSVRQLAFERRFMSPDIIRFMSDAQRLIAEINAAAHAAGTADAIVQFENVGAHRQYRLPYEKTKAHVRAGDRVLDWGCGTGHFSLLLEALGATVTGFSFDEFPTCMSQSSTFRHVRGSPAEPRRLPFADGAFDVVCNVGVLEHVYETGGSEEASLREIARILRANGTFLTFHFPNQSGWIEPVVRRLGLKKHFHHRKYTAEQVRELWSAAGFEILDMGSYNSLPRNELRVLPGMIRHNAAFIAAYDMMDHALTAMAPALATNHFVVARKR
jgi:SAM-dependent methyltransferase